MRNPIQEKWQSYLKEVVEPDVTDEGEKIRLAMAFLAGSVTAYFAACNPEVVQDLVKEVQMICDKTMRIIVAEQYLKAQRN